MWGRRLGHRRIDGAGLDGARGLEKLLLDHGLGRGDEHVWLLQSGLDAAAGQIEIGWLKLYAGELPPRLDSRYSCGTRAHEWIDYAALSFVDTPAHEFDRLLSRMLATWF